MRLSSIFKIISNEIYSQDMIYLDRKYNTLKSYHNVCSINPLLVEGYYSIYEEDKICFEDKDIKLNNSSILVYDETGHTGEWQIREYNSLKEVEEFILSSAGYFNMFCTFIVVLSESFVFDFKVYCIRDGEKIFVSENDFSSDLDFKVQWSSKKI